jgi:hypothetical protein
VESNAERDFRHQHEQLTAMEKQARADGEKKQIEKEEKR